MWEHEGGFCVARCRSLSDQNEYIIHNRYGAWFVGDPDTKGRMNDVPMVLAGALQEQRRKLGDKIRKEHEPKKVNPFIAKAAKKNPLIARLVAQGKIG